jgi:hypothetical protein
MFSQLQCCNKPGNLLTTPQKNLALHQKSFIFYAANEVVKMQEELVVRHELFKKLPYCCYVLC